MKKLIITLAIAMCGCVLANAQDLAAATEASNNGVEANAAGNVELALQCFKEALSIAEPIDSDDARKIVEDCKAAIPALQFSLAKKAVNSADYDNAIKGLRETIEIAAKYENDAIVADATALIPQVLMQQANGYLNDKDYENAAQTYKAVIAEDATNGMAYLRLGSALKATGDKEGAIEAFKSAAANGQEKNANKQLSTLYQQEANAALVAKKFNDAIAAATESNKYLETPKAYQIAGTAASAAKKQKEAIEYFEKYLELAPTAGNVTQIYYNIAVCHHQLGNKAKAKEYYLKAVDDPKLGASAKQMAASL